MGSACRTLTLRHGEKRWSRKPSGLPEVRDSPVEGYCHLPGAWGFWHPHSRRSANLSVPTPSLTCATPAGQSWGWAWRGTWGQ